VLVKATITMYSAAALLISLLLLICLFCAFFLQY
jgi:hypothetical protein